MMVADSQGGEAERGHRVSRSWAGAEECAMVGTSARVERPFESPSKSNRPFWYRPLFALYFYISGRVSAQMIKLF